MWDLIVSVPDHCLSFYIDITIRDILGTLNPTINVDKLKKALSLSNVHISKMAAKLKKNDDICKELLYKMPNWYKSW